MAVRRDQAALVRRWQIGAVGTLVGVGLLGLGLYTTAAEHPLSALGAGMMIACATTVAGTLLGFLFGIPHSRSAPQPSGQPDGQPNGDYSANTNLEQVSDWLTKLLLGVGLTQLSRIWQGARQLGHALAPALGGRADAAPFAAALVLYFLVLGFLAGWLATRLLLAGVLTQADGNALRLFNSAQEQLREGNEVGAEDLRVQAMAHMGKFSTRAMGADPQRTAAMDAQVAEVRAGAKQSTATPEEVRGLFASDDSGLRLQALALTQGNPGLGDFESVLEYIEHPRTPFEHYQALLAARGMINRLGRDQRIRLRAAVVAQLLAPDGIPDASDRRWVAERILAKLDAIGQVPTPRPSGV
ncbi:hypothetical protein C7C46_08685 [Streptomyces tateyamensis]|uniref:Uncharacterized protein n=1 Tax=Streptomyces tateyamensis TaxID=565073 RepID=A0A2V4NFC3_9ACTN|nr:hypothetical protein [Streptomyces tateyamensis]PYC83809.1 hypothetical protein C7C46_08685 [Streptomyces tateyamensis]